MTKYEFENYLLIYGTQFETWPEEIRETGKGLCHSSPEFTSKFEEIKKFEKALQVRSFEPPEGNLSERIVAAAKQKRRPFSFGLLGSEFFGLFLSPGQRVATVTALIVFGFFVGYSEFSFLQSEEIDLSLFLYEGLDGSLR